MMNAVPAIVTGRDGSISCVCRVPDGLCACSPTAHAEASGAGDVVRSLRGVSGEGSDAEPGNLFLFRVVP